MKLVVGLGNPGGDYTETRHNVGYKTIDELQKMSLPGDVLTRKTNVFMNQSGGFVESQVSKYQIKETDLYVVHDDLDIPLGEYKIQYAKGPKDHNGLKSIDEALGGGEYWHVRIGVDNRPEDNRPMGEEYVLQNFPDEEKVIIQRVIKEACKKLETLLKNTN
jgi:PTH1 family peptidyl-tRNA hydrolase